MHINAPSKQFEIQNWLLGRGHVVERPPGHGESGGGRVSRRKGCHDGERARGRSKERRHSVDLGPSWRRKKDHHDHRRHTWAHHPAAVADQTAAVGMQNRDSNCSSSTTRSGDALPGTPTTSNRSSTLSFASTCTSATTCSSTSTFPLPLFSHPSTTFCLSNPAALLSPGSISPVKCNIVTMADPHKATTPSDDASRVSQPMGKFLSPFPGNNLSHLFSLVYLTHTSYPDWKSCSCLHQLPAVFTGRTGFPHNTTWPKSSLSSVRLAWARRSLPKRRVLEKCARQAWPRQVPSPSIRRPNSSQSRPATRRWPILSSRCIDCAGSARSRPI